MNYLQTHNRNGFSRRRGLWGSVAVFVVIVILIQLLVPHFLPAIFTTIARPFWRIEFSVNSGSLSSPDSLLSQNEALKRQLVDLTVRLETTQSISNENIELKTLLNRPVGVTASSTLSSTTSSASFSTFVQSKYTLAAVLKRPPISPYDELIIDIGQNNGVAVGNLVYAPGNVLIGSVSDTLGETSKVSLFSSAGMTYDVLVSDAAVGKNIPAVAHGLGGGQFSVQVPRDVVSNTGDIVTVPSINNKTIGIVGGVAMDPAQPFETILFTSLANIYELHWVLVDTKVTATSSSVQIQNHATATATSPSTTTKNAKK